jgi:hypothetical protein
MIRALAHRLRGFGKDRSGAAMVEFAISLPILLLVTAVVIEGSRITWTHQAAASGVRDAARFLSRITPANLCDDATGVNNYPTEYGARATEIVAARVGAPDTRVLPGGVDVIGVIPSVDCVDVDYQTADVAVVEVRVRLQITFPFAGAFDFFGEPLAPLVTEISDESRVFGT